MSKLRHSFALGASVLVLATAATPAFAQEAEDKDTGANPEIVVTAQFREQKLQDTPLSITAVDATLLESRAGAVPMLLTERDGVSRYHTIFFARRDSGIATLDDLRGRSLLLIDYDAAITLHPVVPGTPKERRAERLASETADDNRISFGCINVPPGFYERVVRPAFTGTAGIVYILPETVPAEDLFGH